MVGSQYVNLGGDRHSVRDIKSFGVKRACYISALFTRGFKTKRACECCA